MKYTLLDMVQRILSSMDSDEVDSIFDTVESQQVAYVVQQVYNDMVAGTDFPEQYSFFELTPSGSTSSPVLMTIPPEVRSFSWIRYNSFTASHTTANWVDMIPVSLDEMMRRSFDLLPTDTNVTTCSVPLPLGSSKNFYCYNDRNPLNYAAINSDTILFDAYLVDVDSTLQKSKSLGYGRVEYDFSLTDTFTPHLDEKQFNILLNEAKALAFAELKQASHAKAEKQARKGWINYARTRNNSPSSIKAADRLPDYGRTPNTPTALSHSRNNGT